MITRKPNKLPQFQTIAFQDFQTLSNYFSSQPFQSSYIFISEIHLYYYPAHIFGLFLLIPHSSAAAKAEGSGREVSPGLTFTKTQYNVIQQTNMMKLLCDVNGIFLLFT